MSFTQLASGPTFVKSKQTTLFTESQEIKESRQKKAKVTFAKPKVKVAQTEKAATAEGDFVKKGGKVDREKKEKEQRLKEQVD